MLTISKDFLEFVRPSPHSRFSPSACDRWLITGCPFSVNFCKDIPEETSVYAEEGTVAHSLCEAVFRKNFIGLEIPFELKMQVAQHDDTGEMLQCAEMYSDVLTYWLKNKDQVGEILYYGLEKGVPIYPKKGCFGTSDCVIVGTKATVIIDYKHGKGKNVAATSKQLKCYLAGMYMHLDFIPDDYKFYAVVFQPRTDLSPKEACYGKEEIREFSNVIYESISMADKKDLAPVEGNHCYWCPANRTKDNKFKCPIVLERPMKLAKENFAQFFADMGAPIEKIGAPNPARDEAIAKLMTLYPLIKATIENCSEEIKMRLMDGEHVEGFRLVEKEGKRMLSFTDDKEAIQTLKQAFPKLNPTKIIPATEKLKTITEIEKEIGKNKLDPFCTKKITKEVEVLDEKSRAILGELIEFGESLTNNHEE